MFLLSIYYAMVTEYVSIQLSGFALLCSLTHISILLDFCCQVRDYLPASFGFLVTRNTLAPLYSSAPFWDWCSNLQGGYVPNSLQMPLGRAAGTLVVRCVYGTQLLDGERTQCNPGSMCRMPVIHKLLGIVLLGLIPRHQICQLPPLDFLVQLAVREHEILNLHLSVHPIHIRILQNCTPFFCF